MMAKRLCLTAIALLLLNPMQVKAETISTPLDDFVGSYSSGPTGNPAKSTTYDFGVNFTEVSSATLHIEGEAWNGGGSRLKMNTQLSFIVDLEGQESRFSHEITKRETRKNIGRYSEDFPLLFDDSVLDGTGPISLTVYTFGAFDHMSSSITNASLIFDGVTLDLPVAFTTAVPEPTTMFLATLGVLPFGRIAQHFRK